VSKSEKVLACQLEQQRAFARLFVDVHSCGCLWMCIAVKRGREGCSKHNWQGI